MGRRAVAVPAAPLAGVRAAVVSQHRQLTMLWDMVLLGAAEAVAASRQGRPPGPSREGTFGRFRVYLAAHEALEQVCLHPLAEGQFGQYAGVVAHRLAEEEQIAQLVGALEGVELFGVRFRALLPDLSECLLAHLQAEEHQEMAALTGLDDRDLAVIARGLARVEPIAAGLGACGRFEDLLESACIQLLAPRGAPGGTR